MIGYRDIIEARDNMHPDIIRTPLQVWRHGSGLTGKTVQLKEETLQRTGSFKCRGAWNRLRLLSEEERKAGVVCASAGNHAQGVSLAASLVGTQATIVMPDNTAKIKVTQTKLYNTPEIIFHGRNLAEAYIYALNLQRERGSVFISPYDDDAIIAGQGTIGLEIVEEWPDVDTVLVPVGGGGLLAGITVAVHHHNPDVKVLGVQAAGADSAARSLERASRLCLRESRTVADGINVSEIGERPFEILSKHKVPIVRVTDDQICYAVTDLCVTAKLVVEPAGAAAAAVVLFNPAVLDGQRRIVCVLSGANIDPIKFANLLSTYPSVQD
jgi:threonine dehydratase